jgi:hypothetical protein
MYRFVGYGRLQLLTTTRTYCAILNQNLASIKLHLFMLSTYYTAMLIMQGDAGVHYLAPTRLVRSYLLIERCYMLEASAGSYSLILRSLSQDEMFWFLTQIRVFFGQGHPYRG